MPEAREYDLDSALRDHDVVRGVEEAIHDTFRLGDLPHTLVADDGAGGERHRRDGREAKPSPRDHALHLGDVAWAVHDPPTAARAALDGRSKGIAEDRTRGRARCPLDEARVIGLTAASPLARRLEPIRCSPVALAMLEPLDGRVGVIVTAQTQQSGSCCSDGRGSHFALPPPRNADAGRDRRDRLGAPNHRRR